MRFDPTEFDKSINELGIQKRFFHDDKVWLGRYRDVKNISSAKELETVLYKQTLWSRVKGRFANGATLRVVRNIDDAVPAGVTNKIDGIPQWRITRDIAPSDLEIIRRLEP